MGSFGFRGLGLRAAQGLKGLGFQAVGFRGLGFKEGAQGVKGARDFFRSGVRVHIPFRVWGLGFGV